MPKYEPNLERDGDCTSDEEETDWQGKYSFEKQAEALKKNQRFLDLVKAGFNEALILRLFRIHVENTQRLYSKEVNEKYYKEYKPILGKFERSEEETPLETFEDWLSDTIEECFASLFGKTDLEDALDESSLKVARERIKKFAQTLTDKPKNLRLFLKKIRLRDAHTKLTALLLMENLTPIKHHLRAIKSNEGIRKPNNATASQEQKHIAKKSPIKTAEALLQHVTKNNNKNKAKCLIGLLDSEENTGKYTNIFIALVAARLAETRASKRIYFERNLPKQLPNIPLGSKDGINLALATRVFTYDRKSRRNELENLMAIYGSDSTSSTFTISPFTFGFGGVYNRSSVSSNNLGRNEYVTEGGAYKTIATKIKSIKERSNNSINDKDITLWLRQALGGEINEKSALKNRFGNKIPTLLEKALGIKNLISDMACLLFFIEPIRHPSAYTFSLQSCQLVEADICTWTDILTHQEIARDKKGQIKKNKETKEPIIESVSGGLHPMTHVKIVESSRYLLNLFAPYSPYPYSYEGEESTDNVRLYIEHAHSLQLLIDFEAAWPGCGRELIEKYELKTSITILKNSKLKGIAPLLAADQMYLPLDDDELDSLGVDYNLDLVERWLNKLKHDSQSDMLELVDAFGLYDVLDFYQGEMFSETILTFLPKMCLNCDEIDLLKNQDNQNTITAWLNKLDYQLAQLIAQIGLEKTIIILEHKNIPDNLLFAMQNYVLTYSEANLLIEAAEESDLSERLDGDAYDLDILLEIVQPESESEDEGEPLSLQSSSSLFFESSDNDDTDNEEEEEEAYQSDFSNNSY